MSVTTLVGEAFVCDAILAKLTDDVTTLYAELCIAAPSKSAAGTPATGVARTAIALSRTDDKLVNAEVSYGNATANETYVGINIWTAASAGARYFFGCVADGTFTSTAAVTGQPVKILAAAFLYSPDANT